MFGLSDIVIKMILIGIVTAAIGAAYLAWHHSIVVEGKNEQIVIDAPVMDHCKADFSVTDPKACAASWVQFLADRKAALDANQTLGGQIKTLQSAVAGLMEENDAVEKATALASANAAKARAAAKLATDQYMAIVNRPAQPDSPAQVAQTKTILRTLVAP